jgi:hypothetical protein
MGGEAEGRTVSIDGVTFELVRALYRIIQRAVREQVDMLAADAQYDPRDSVPDDGASAKQPHLTPDEPHIIAEIILLTSKLHLLRLHKARKSSLIASSAASTRESTPGIGILPPILRILQYRQALHAASGVLHALALALERVGVPAGVKHVWSAAAEGVKVGDVGRAVRSGEVGRFLGGTAVLDAEGL